GLADHAEFRVHRPDAEDGLRPRGDEFGTALTGPDLVGEHGEFAATIVDRRNSHCGYCRRGLRIAEQRGGRSSAPLAALASRRHEGLCSRQPFDTGGLETLE